MTRNSTRARRICWETHKTEHPVFKTLGMWCHVCGCWIDNVKVKWRADHIRRHAEGGEDTPENLFPICLDCDTGPDGKAAQDTTFIAKGKRVAEKHFGIREKRSKLKKPAGMKFDWQQGRYVRTR